MSSKLEVSFNSPQCGWMSVGFKDGNGEFHTTTAHAPHKDALAELLAILTSLIKGGGERVLPWNRDPEEFDLRFVPGEAGVLFEVYEYPDPDRDAEERELVFSHTGDAADICRAFAETFRRLYEDRDTDDFEFNWHQPFPVAEYERFTAELGSAA
ncbi:MAG: hypothetical protein UZ17_ACD001001702 [Acidobacteria bacterium OLB17]|nr:MAG: hypothetical protein UZ17_ACD001001702 [Acidobacteria bacterium OLB17]MCZ2390707.1 hypothetical protein [Acidobacteriota bacterium]